MVKRFTACFNDSAVLSGSAESRFRAWRPLHPVHDCGLRELPWVLGRVDATRAVAHVHMLVASLSKPRLPPGGWAVDELRTDHLSLLRHPMSKLVRL